MGLVPPVMRVRKFRPPSILHISYQIIQIKAVETRMRKYGHLARSGIAFVLPNNPFFTPGTLGAACECTVKSARERLFSFVPYDEDLKALTNPLYQRRISLEDWVCVGPTTKMDEMCTIRTVGYRRNTVHERMPCPS